MRDLLSVADAAKELGLSVRRVRALISAGELPAQRVGKSWALEQRAVERFKGQGRRSGRPLKARNGWALLGLLAGIEPAWLKADARSRLRRYSRQQDWVLGALEHAEPRANVLGLWMPASDLPKLAGYPIVWSGLSARNAVSHLDVIPRRDEPLDGYASPQVLEDVLRRFAPEKDVDDPNVILRVLDHVPPVLSGREEAPLPVAAADLLDHDDPRVRRAAKNALAQLVDAS